MRSSQSSQSFKNRFAFFAAKKLKKEQATNGSGYNTSRAGAKPHGQKDKVLLPKKLILALPTSNQEPTLSARNGSGASPPDYVRPGLVISSDKTL